MCVAKVAKCGSDTPGPTLFTCLLFGSSSIIHLCCLVVVEDDDKQKKIILYTLCTNTVQ